MCMRLSWPFLVRSILLLHVLFHSEHDDQDGGEDPANLRRSPHIGRSSSSAAARQDLSRALQEAVAQVEALKSELDKMRRENESLQAQLTSKSHPDRY